MTWPFGRRAGAGYALGLFATALGAGWALDAGAGWLAAIAGTLALAVSWRATVHYREWATSGEQHASGSRLGVCAGVGVASCTAGAVLLALASDHDARALAAVGIAFVVAGLIPIMHAIRYEPEPVDRPWEDVAFGWVLNTLFAFAALSPGLLVLGAPVVIAAVVPAAWLASVAVNRLARFHWYRLVVMPVLALGAVVSAVWFLTLSDPGSDVTLTVVLLAVCLGCIDGLSAPVRREHPVDWSSTRTAVAVALGAAAVVAAALRAGQRARERPGIRRIGARRVLRRVRELVRPAGPGPRGAGGARRPDPLGDRGPGRQRST